MNSTADSLAQTEPLTSAANGSGFAPDLTELAASFAYREKTLARQRIIDLSVRACDRGVALSDAARLPAIEELSRRHLRIAAAEWDRITQNTGSEHQEQIAQQIRAIYDDEARSFYRSPSELPGADPDVRKDYPDLVAQVRSSTLDDATKSVLTGNLGYLQYEEAGHLFNSLRNIGPDAGFSYAYLLRRDIEARVADAGAQQRAAQEADARRAELLRTEASARSASMALKLGIALLIALVLAVPLLGRLSYAFAKYRAFKTGAKQVPFLGGGAELILWDPGETVVILEHKRLVPLGDPMGGYRVISAWRGQEYKGRITYKTQFTTWNSDPIFTSDGLSVNLTLGIWWRIANANTYISAIASDYHEGDQHRTETLTEAAEFWIRKLAAGTLREHVNKLPTSTLISPYVQAYIQVRDGGMREAIPQFSELLSIAQQQIGDKTGRYGIEIERLEVQQLSLPQVYQEKLEAVRTAFLQPDQSRAETEAQVIALQGLASVIGADRVGLIEILKHIDFSTATANPLLNLVSMVQPVTATVQQEAARTLARTETEDTKKIASGSQPPADKPPPPPPTPGAPPPP